MATKSEKVPVIFRMFDGYVIALFPTLPGTNDPWTCSSYMHVGQHGSADLQHVIRSSYPAKPDEYAALERELRSAPFEYDLTIKSRVSPAMNAARKAELRRVRGG